MTAQPPLCKGGRKGGRERWILGGSRGLAISWELVNISRYLSVVLQDKRRQTGPIKEKTNLETTKHKQREML